MQTMKLSKYPQSPQIQRRIDALLSDVVSINQRFFRMVSPGYCKDSDIINGKGGKNAAGRWNVRGAFFCTYASTTPETALEESLSRVRHDRLPDETALPRTLVCIELKASKVLDLTDSVTRRRLRISLKRMIDQKEWLYDNYNNQESLTQAMGRAAFLAKLEAIIVPSAADRPDGTNVVIFPDNLLATSNLNVVTPVK